MFLSGKGLNIEGPDFVNFIHIKGRVRGGGSPLRGLMNLIAIGARVEPGKAQHGLVFHQQQVSVSVSDGYLYQDLEGDRNRNPQALTRNLTGRRLPG